MIGTSHHRLHNALDNLNTFFAFVCVFHINHDICSLSFSNLFNYIHYICVGNIVADPIQAKQKKSPTKQTFRLKGSQSTFFFFQIRFYISDKCMYSSPSANMIMIFFETSCQLYLFSGLFNVNFCRLHAHCYYWVGFRILNRIMY